MSISINVIAVFFRSYAVFFRSCAVFFRSYAVFFRSLNAIESYKLLIIGKYQER